MTISASLCWQLWREAEEIRAAIHNGMTLDDTGREWLCEATECLAAVLAANPVEPVDTKEMVA